MRPNVIRGLVVFCAAARYLSFKMAADELYITPSAVSHQIKAIEDLLGAPLFERRTRSIVLTPVGAALYSQTGPLLSSLDAVASEFLAKSSRRRVLRISLPQFFASEVLIPRLEAFTQAHPSLDIHVDTTDGRDTEFSSDGDAAVRLLPSEPKGYCAVPLFGLELIPACAPAYAERHDLHDRKTLSDCTLIIHRSRPDAWNDWLALTGTQLVKQPRIIELDNMFAVARAAERGLGIALVPLRITGAWIQSGALVTPLETILDAGEQYYFMCRPRDANDSDIVMLRRWTIDICAAHE